MASRGINCLTREGDGGHLSWTGPVHSNLFFGRITTCLSSTAVLHSFASLLPDKRISISLSVILRSTYYAAVNPPPPLIFVCAPYGPLQCTSTVHAVHLRVFSPLLLLLLLLRSISLFAIFSLLFFKSILFPKIVYCLLLYKYVQNTSIL